MVSDPESGPFLAVSLGADTTFSPGPRSTRGSLTWRVIGKYFTFVESNRTQSKRAVFVQLLVAGPTYRIAHSFHLDLCLQSKSRQFCPFRQQKLRLTNFPRQRIPGVQTAALQRLTILAFHGHPQHARNTGNPIICKADNEPCLVAVAPDQRRSHPVTNSPVDPVERSWR